MERFTALYTTLDETNRTTAKVAALAAYFEDAPPEDAAWALYFLTGNRFKRSVTGAQLRAWVAEESGLPGWLVEESYDAVGDIAETVALLLPDPGKTATSIPLHRMVEERIAPLGELEEEERRALVVRTWNELNRQERFVWHKLLTGGFRVGVGRTLVVRALANVVGIDPAIMAHRIMGAWEPTATSYLALLDPDTAGADHSRPYPFYLAYQLDDEPESLGSIHDWQLEWKWDGIRAQVIKRQGEVLVWTRGEELVTDAYPEVAELGAALPDGVVLDGEVLAWDEDAPLPFNVLQRRLGRKKLSAKILREAPVILMAYDLLEADGRDIRSHPLDQRRARLAALVEPLVHDQAVRMSPPVAVESWQAAADLRATSRARGAEGFMLKRRDAAYGVGRKKGDWWKWKVDPLTIDVVMIYAQRGHGRRASLYSDYTFAVWDDDTLVPIAKAYSGLTDDEIRQVDAFVRRNITDRFGPVRAVKPELVFELAFEGIQRSPRHKSGIALRFPRMARRRLDKQPEEADTLATVQALLATVEAGHA